MALLQTYLWKAVLGKKKSLNLHGKCLKTEMKEKKRMCLDISKIFNQNRTLQSVRNVEKKLGINILLNFAQLNYKKL